MGQKPKMEIMPFPPMITRNQFKLYFDSSDSHIHRMEKEGILKPKYLGAKKFYLTEDILNALSETPKALFVAPK